MSLPVPASGMEPLRRHRVSQEIALPPRPAASRRSLVIRPCRISQSLRDRARPSPERRKDIHTDDWLDRLALIVHPPKRRAPPEPRAARIDRAVYVVLDTLDDLLFMRNEVRCREILERTDVERLPIEVLLALLGATLRAREALGASREGLCRRVEEKLRRDAPARVELLLRGLR